MRISLWTLVAIGSLWAGNLEAQTIKDYRSSSKTGPSVYVVQLGKLQSRDAAEKLKERIESQGYSPVNIASNETTFTVSFGQFPNLVEAWIEREAFRSKGISSIVSKVKSSDDVSQSVVWKGPAPSVFGLKPGELLKQKLQTLKGDKRYEYLESLDKPGNEKFYEENLIKALSDCSEDDPLKGYIVVNLGALALKKGNRMEANDAFTTVAKGLVPSAAVHRSMAMRRNAWTIHNGKKDRLEAYKAYDELEKQTTSPALIATCKVEKMGLLMELAGAKKGTYEEVRLSMADAWKSIPDSLPTQKATIELMFSETYGKQPQPDNLQAAKLSEEFVERWMPMEKKQWKELGAAMCQGAMYWQRYGDDKKAEYWIQRTLSDFPTTAPIFGGQHPHSHALITKAELLKGDSFEDERHQIYRDIMEYFPQDNMTKKIRKANPNFEKRVKPSSVNPVDKFKK